MLVLIGAGLGTQTASEVCRIAAHRGWPVGATTAAVGSGYVPASREVSLHRRSMSPRVVVALGLAGVAELDAVRGAGTLITVDADPEAAVHRAADLAGVVAVPAFLDALAGADPGLPEPGR
ncbi:MAG TPA: FAD-binding protein [Jiangellales bacterium]|nr:FAD-binding protein [Jiangellales bacterium]